MNEDDEKAFSAYRLIAEQIIKEDNLIHQRVTWGFTINGALLTLIALFFNLTKDVPNAFPVARFVLIALALLAIWVCYITFRNIRGARTQIAYVSKIYEKHWKNRLENDLNLPRPFGGSLYGKYPDGTPITLKIVGSEQLFIAIGILWIGVLILTPFGLVIKSLLLP